MDDLQSAVLLCLDPSADPTLRQRAFDYCQQLRQSPQGCPFVLQHLSPDMRPEAIFWSLQLIYETISDAQRYTASFPPSVNAPAHLRTTIVAFLRRVVYPPSQNDSNDSNNALNFPVFVLNKLAQVVSALVAAHYPHEWSTPFQHVILPLIHTESASAAANASTTHPLPANAVTLPSVTMCYRLLRTLDDDVTSIRAASLSKTHREISVRVKDAMRDDCIPTLIAVSATFLREPKVARFALDFVARYVEWVDISLVVQPPILTPVYDAITARAPCAWRAAAAAALKAVVMKRMDVKAKAALLRRLQVGELLDTIAADVIVAQENDTNVDSELNLQGAQAEVAALVNAIAMSALDMVKMVWKVRAEGTSNEVMSANGDGNLSVSVNGHASASSVSVENGNASSNANVNANANVAKQLGEDRELFEYVSRVARNALPVALQFLDEGAEDGTGAQTLECVTSYVNVYGNAGRNGTAEGGEERLAIATVILKVVAERARFAPDVDPLDDNSESGGTFSEVRKVLLKKVFASVGRFFPMISVDFVLGLYNSAAHAGDVARLEVALSMVVTLMGVAMDSSEVAQLCRRVLSNPPKCLGALNGKEVLSVVSQHLVELVVKSYFEIVGRSAKLLASDEDDVFMNGVLHVIFDERGLGCAASEVVRSAAAHALVRIAKPLRGVMKSGHVQATVRAAHQHVLPIVEDVHSERWKNQMVIVETIGYLLGMEQKRSGAVDLLFSMLKPIVEGIERETEMGCVANIAAAGYLSKGFGGDCKIIGVEDGGDNGINAAKRDGDGGNGAVKNGKVVVVKDVKGMVISDEMRAVWLKCLDTVMKAGWASLRGGNEAWMEEMRLKMLLFLHRMVETIGAGVVPYLEKVMPELMKWGRSAAEIREVMSVMSQSVIKFGKSAIVVARVMHGMFVARMREVKFSVDEGTMMAVSETDREAVDVVRAFVYWVNCLISQELMEVVLGAEGGEFAMVMNWLVEYGVGERMDVRVASAVMRMSWQAVGQVVMLVGKGVGAGDARLKGFDEFAVRTVSAALVRCGVKGVVVRNGDYSSGQVSAVMTEVVKVVRICTLQYGAMFSDAMFKEVAGPVSRPEWDVVMGEIVGNDESLWRWILMMKHIASQRG